MERVSNLRTRDNGSADQEALAFWRARPAAERLAEVDRLRREHIAVFLKDDPDGLSQRLRRFVRVIERKGR